MSKNSKSILQENNSPYIKSLSITKTIFPIYDVKIKGKDLDKAKPVICTSGGKVISRTLPEMCYSMTIKNLRSWALSDYNLSHCTIRVFEQKNDFVHLRCIILFPGQYYTIKMLEEDRESNGIELLISAKDYEPKVLSVMELSPAEKNWWEKAKAKFRKYDWVREAINWFIAFATLAGIVYSFFFQ